MWLDNKAEERIILDPGHGFPFANVCDLITCPLVRLAIMSLPIGHSSLLRSVVQQMSSRCFYAVCARSENKTHSRLHTLRAGIVRI